MNRPSIDLHYEDRAVPELLGGVLYQIVRTAKRWRSLGGDEVLVVEGDEDLVVATIKDGEVLALEQEQIKLLSGRITARAPAAYETLFAFLCSFHALSIEGKRCSFVFTTNAALGAQQVEQPPAAGEAVNPSKLYVDLLKTWRESRTMTAERAADLKAGVKALVTSYVDRAYATRAPDAKGPKPSIDAQRVRGAIEFLDEQPERWETFLRAVELDVDAGDAQKVFDELAQSIEGDDRSAGIDPAALAYRVVFEVMQTGAQPEYDARHLRRSDLDTLIERERAKLLDWMRSAHPERLWQLDLVNDLRRRVEQLEGGRASSVAGKELRARHLAAVRAQNAIFRVLGIEQDISIERAWVLAARWADTEPRRGSAFHAHRSLESSHQMIMLVGEGGAGKSTLLRRLAWDAADRGEVVLRVRAKTLSALANDEPTFAVALRRVIADQSGVTFEEATQLERELDVLLLDGLDEVGERAQALASECVAYAAAREGTRVVVTARPSHATLVDARFARANLLAIEPTERWSVVVELLRSTGEAPDNAKRIASRLDAILKDTSFESLPLHITMALVLARSEGPEHVSLASLYERTLTSLRTRPMSDRADAHVDTVFAARVLDAAAWHLGGRERSPSSDLVSAIAEAVGGRGLEREVHVERALLFWEGRAVLRRDRVGGIDRFEFAHDTLRDFVAAQHLVALPVEDRRAWLADRKNEAVVRFAVAIGGEAVLDDVFATDAPTSVDALVRCALAAREMGHAPSRFAVELATNAAPFVASNIPYTVGRVVDAVLPLASAAPDAFATAAAAAMEAGDAWNVLAAWLLRVRSGAELKEPDALLEFLRSGASRDRGVDSIEWNLWNTLLEPALDLLVRMKTSTELDELLDMLVTGDATLSAAAHDRIVAKLPDWGYSDLLSRYRAKYEGDLTWLDDLRTRAAAADKAFLELVEATFAASAGGAADTGLPNLSALLQAFNFYHSASTDWNEAFFKRGASSMSVLLRGASRAAGCDEAMLSTEAKHALKVFGVARDELSSAGLRKLGSGSPRELDWGSTSSISLPIPHLVSVLRWPSSYARVALILLAHHVDRVAVQSAIANALEDGVPFVVEAAEHLSDLLGQKFVDVLARAVAGGNPTSAALLPTLASIEPTSPRTLKLVTDALANTNGAVVDAAADAAAKLHTAQPLLAALRSQVERWRKWAAGDGPLEKRESGLVEPGTTLHAKGVAGKLVRALATHRALTYEELLQLARDGAGASEALDAIVALVTTDPVALEIAIDDIASGVVSASVAVRLLASDAVPLVAKTRLLALHEHPNSAVRHAIVVGLRGCSSVAREEACRVWNERLADDDVRIRNEAQRALDGAPRSWPPNRAE